MEKTMESTIMGYSSHSLNSFKVYYDRGCQGGYLEFRL